MKKNFKETGENIIAVLGCVILIFALLGLISLVGYGLRLVPVQTAAYMGVTALIVEAGGIELLVLLRTVFDC
jgi:hypothetical protein